MKCKKHPRYQGKRHPKVICVPCWAFFFAEETRRGWVTMAKQELERIKASNGGKDRPTYKCTKPHHNSDVCYGCDPWYC
jgi:hypothetical protein